MAFGDNGKRKQCLKINTGCRANNVVCNLVGIFTQRLCF